MSRRGIKGGQILAVIHQFGWMRGPSAQSYTVWRHFYLPDVVWSLREDEDVGPVMLRKLAAVIVRILHSDQAMTVLGSPTDPQPNGWSSSAYTWLMAGEPSGNHWNLDAGPDHPSIFNHCESCCEVVSYDDPGMCPNCELCTVCCECFAG